MCFVNDDPPEFFIERYVVARKQHWCCECRGMIPLGTLHQAATGKWDDAVETFRTCAYCVSLREAVEAHEEDAGCNSYESTPPFGYLWEAASEARLVTQRRDWDEQREEARP